MANFINEQTNSLFDGSQPYVFWFGEGQSTNINYIQRIFVVLPTASARIEINSDVFDLVDVSLIPTQQQVWIHGRGYFDLVNITTNVFNSTGTAYNSFYIHCFYLHARTAVIGEHIDVFRIYTIDQHGVETLEGEYLVGGDFYSGNELLTANLTNRGFEIPPEFQKGLYETNVREDAQDNIVMNEKFKELLFNFFDTVAIEGNYKALANTLEWWEYGDLVKMREFWKHYQWDKFFYEYIKRLPERDFKDKIRSQVKTTYIGLYFALNHVDDENIEYQNTECSIYHYDIIQHGNDPWEQATIIPMSAYSNDITRPMMLLNEPIPLLYETVKRWTTEDITLKMTVLGDFFRTYFTPVHLDLEHSTVERLIYSDTMKILEGQYMERRDFFDSLQPLEVEVDCDCQMQTVECYVTQDTLFRNPYWDTISSADPNNPDRRPETLDEPSWYNVPPATTPPRADQTGQFDGWVGVTHHSATPMNEEGATAIDDVEHYYQSELRYGGIGCIADICVRFDDSGTIFREVCAWRGEGTVTTYTNVGGVERMVPRPDVVTRISNNVYQSVDNHFEIRFSLLFRASGWHNVLLQFDSTTGHTYCAQFNIYITPEQRPLVNVYKVSRDNIALRRVAEIDTYARDNDGDIITDPDNYDLPVDSVDKVAALGEAVDKLGLPMNLYSMLTHDAHEAYAWRYGQFICGADNRSATPTNTAETVGLNHYVAVVVKNDDEIRPKPAKYFFKIYGKVTDVEPDTTGTNALGNYVYTKEVGGDTHHFIAFATYNIVVGGSSDLTWGIYGGVAINSIEQLNDNTYRFGYYSMIELWLQAIRNNVSRVDGISYTVDPDDPTNVEKYTYSIHGVSLHNSSVPAYYNGGLFNWENVHIETVGTNKYLVFECDDTRVRNVVTSIDRIVCIGEWKEYDIDDPNNVILYDLTTIDPNPPYTMTLQITSDFFNEIERNNFHRLYRWKGWVATSYMGDSEVVAPYIVGDFTDDIGIFRDTGNRNAIRQADPNAPVFINQMPRGDVDRLCWMLDQSATTSDVAAQLYYRYLEYAYPDYWWWCERVITAPETSNPSAGGHAASDYPQHYVIRGVSKFFTVPDDPRNVRFTDRTAATVYSSEQTRFIDDCRFFAMFNKVGSFVTDDAFTIDRHETIVVIPSSLRTSPVTEIDPTTGTRIDRFDHGVEDSIFISFLPLSYGAWEFCNTSTGRVFRSVREDKNQTPAPDYDERVYFDTENALVFDYTPLMLTRGYYDIVLRYKLGNHPNETDVLVQSVSKESAFAVR